MSSLTTVDKRYLETILNMAGGYVQDFSDRTFEEFFNRYNVDIHGGKYKTSGTSKARKMRAFWEQEPDDLVGSVLSELLDNYEASCDLNRRERDTVSLGKSREIVARLSGKSPGTSSTSDEGFLNKEFGIPNLQKLPVDFAVAEIIKDRLEEARLCLSHGAYLSAIFQCGSVLEAVLLGAAQNEPGKFNRSSSSPKLEGKVKPFYSWTLSEFINVAHDVGLVKLDVQRFSHGVRDFRNYIHPYEQISSGFRPDEHTAKICFQVLKAALADVAGDRK